MIDGFSVQGSDETKIIGDLGGVGQDFADLHATLPMFGKFESRPSQWETGLIGRHAGEALTLAHRVGQFFSVHLVEQRFVIEQIQLGRPPTHEEVNHSLGLCCVMLVSKDSVWRGVGTFGLHQVLQAQGTQTHCGTAQKRSTACKVCAGDIHGCFWGVRNE